MITTDYKLIRSIIEQPDILPGFNHGEIPSEEEIQDPKLIFFYEPGVGLFPANILDKTLIMHAAIPKENRGKKAVKAARELATHLDNNGYDVVTQVRAKHVKFFVKAVGFELIAKTDDLNYYRFKGAKNG